MWHYFDDEDLAAVKEVLDGGNLCSISGTVTRRFEEAFAAEFGSPHAVAVCNAMAGLHAAVAAAGVEPGDEVIVDPLVAFAGLAVMYHNGIPIYADVRRDTHTMDVDSLKSRISPRTRAIIVTQLWGLCADMNEILQVAREHDLVVIEDCAHAIYAQYEGRYAGTIGDIGVFSFQMSKQMALGDAGMVLCRSEAHRDTIHEMITFGTIPARVAWNYRINEVVSAIGTVQLKRARGYADICMESARHYSDAARGFDKLVVPQAVPAGRVNTYHIWTALFEGDKVGVSYDEFQQAHAEAGLGVNFGYIGKPAYLHPTIAEPVGYGKGCPRMCPFADTNPAYKEGLCPVAEDMMPRLMLMGTGGDPEDHRRAAEKWRGVLERFA